MSGESETFKNIIADSNKKLSTLKILANFFNHPDLVAILIRTKVIHNLFEGNKELDINKLDLFHIQYTTTLIELFQKLKRVKEQKYLLISDEIYINEGFISRLKEEVTVNTFPDEVRKHSALICKKLEEAYNMLAGSGTAKFIWTEVLALSQQRCAEFYREITQDQHQRITTHSDAGVYQNTFVTLEKKLAGKLNIQKFKVKLVCGLQYKNEPLEIYEFVNSNDKFIFIPNINDYVKPQKPATSSAYNINVQETPTLNLEQQPGQMPAVDDSVYAQAKKEQANKDMLWGAIWCVGGLIGTFSDTGFIFWGAIVFGGVQFFRGLANS